MRRSHGTHDPNDRRTCQYALQEHPIPPLRTSQDYEAKHHSYNFQCIPSHLHRWDPIPMNVQRLSAPYPVGSDNNKHNPVDRTKAHLPYILPLLKEAVQWLHYNSPDYCMSAPEAPSIPQFSPLQELSE